MEGVREEALQGMIKALDDFMKDVSECVTQLQKDANTCADNMSGDEYSAKAIIRVNACLGKYRQLYERANVLRDKMYAKLMRLEEIGNTLGGDDY